MPLWLATIYLTLCSDGIFEAHLESRGSCHAWSRSKGRCTDEGRKDGNELEHFKLILVSFEGFFVIFPHLVCARRRPKRESSRGSGPRSSDFNRLTIGAGQIPLRNGLVKGKVNEDSFICNFRSFICFRYFDFICCRRKILTILFTLSFVENNATNVKSIPNDSFITLKTKTRSYRYENLLFLMF